MPKAAGTTEHVEAVEEAVRDAAATRTPLRIVGASSWPGGGRPVSAGARQLLLRELTGVVEYTPGDLTLTARAGTTLAEIAHVTGAHRQWLTLDPPGSDAGTIGATIATGSPGPLAHAFGSPRDVILGMELVTGHGERIRSGGRVVKNVAGFDLTRLMTGAWGTLGVITEVTVRLRSRPAVDETLALRAPSADPDIFSRWLLQSPIGTLYAAAMELVNAALAHHLGVGERDAANEPPVLLVRLIGSAELVRAQRAALSSVGHLADAAPDLWARLRACEPDDAAVFRLSHGRARIGETWRETVGLAGPRSETFMHASVGRGVVRCVVPAPLPFELGAGLAHRKSPATIVAERLPAALWGTLQSGVRDRLALGVKRAFDPHHILNPGILGEGVAA
jgi:FAD/FMN-containing dehydrogenase